MERFIIKYSNNGDNGDNGDDGDDGDDGFKNKPSNNIENCEFFKTEEECQNHIDKIQPEWSSKLSVQKIIFQTINQLYDCVGCVVTDGVSFARVKKSCDSPHKLFYANVEEETIEDGEPIILVADFYENHLGE